MCLTYGRSRGTAGPRCLLRRFPCGLGCMVIGQRQDGLCRLRGRLVTLRAPLEKMGPRRVPPAGKAAFCPDARTIGRRDTALLDAHHDPESAAQDTQCNDRRRQCRGSPLHHDHPHARPRRRQRREEQRHRLMAPPSDHQPLIEVRSVGPEDVFPPEGTARKRLCL